MTQDISKLFDGMANIEDNNNSNDLTGFSTQLIAASNQRSKQLIEIVKTDKAIGAQLMDCLKSGTAPVLFELLEDNFSDEIVEDSEFLSGATESQLDRLLESRRSDRSTTKRKGFKTLKAVMDYLAAGYAELVIRQASGKEYSATRGIELDGSEDAIKRRIASLRSKQSRNKKLALLDPTVAEELEEVKAEIERLQGLLGKAPSSKQLKSDLMSELKKLDLASLPPETADRIRKLMEAESK